MVIVIIISIAVIPWGGTYQNTKDVDVTGTKQTSGIAAIDDNLPPSTTVVSASGKTDLAKQSTHSVFEISGPKGTTDYKAAGTKVLATYEIRNAAGQVHRYTRAIDISGYTEPSEAAAVQARLPADAVLLKTDEKVSIDVPIELVKNADGTFSEVVRSVAYRWEFAPGRLDIGILYVLAVLSLAVYGVVVGGWASNNKYSFLGGLRATANMISYEIPLGLAILCVVLMFGTLDIAKLVDGQAGYWIGVIPAWNCFSQPLPFILFVICIHAEANRAPFDTAEAEQELVGGYHTEYSAMRFALFFLAEYAGMVTTSAICVALFLGGWHLPYLDYLWPAIGGNVAGAPASVTDSLIACLVRTGVFFGKTVAIIFLFMWVRWSLPRFRFDQIMILAWRALIPISLALLMATAVTIYLTAGPTAAGEPTFVKPIAGTLALALLAMNVIVLIATMFISKLLPQPSPTNRKMPLPNSRFRKTPLPGKPVERIPVAAAT
ncbi:NADH-quinone oxidoreductase subunit H [Humisphaera borealis]|uniref:NADH-quinone oxidoreductase subunit H n=2 Tax=Humisphaera borealis TaxID=2807512 RepID=A0A7M2X423_9BACT|nr:NADH-quinone oxidoreductase subunit H [Humisphaera borealis]